VLGLKQSATDAEIKKAYHQAALKWHTDKWREGHTFSLEIITQAFQLVSEAYQMLSVAELREEYDNYMKSYSHNTFRPDMLFPGFKFSDPYKTFAQSRKSR
jgi:DnaJ-class molecular chaperone